MDGQTVSMTALVIGQPIICKMILIKVGREFAMNTAKWKPYIEKTITNQ